MAFSYNPAVKPATYIGAKKCSMCHKKAKDGEQFKIWENSKHAKAYKSLQTAEADEIAKKAGHTTKAAETDACLECHATGYNFDASLLDKKFNVDDGVQCETCHGAGSKYKSNKIMKDRAKAVENGLIVFENDEAIKTACVKCHNEKSPTYKAFDFTKRWAEIKHNIPKS